MIHRNIHIAAEDSEDTSAPAPRFDQDTPAPPAPLGRLRELTNDPAREYAQRPGEVAPLPDAVAALILCKAGRCLVERHQVKASIDGVERFYSAPNSTVIAELNGTGRKVLWVANRRKPDCIHLLDDKGGYLETLPLKAEGQWFDQGAASQAALAAAATHRRRDMERLAILHEPDAREAAAREVHNGAQIAGEMQRIVHTFPQASPGSTHRGETSFPKAERLAAADRVISGARDQRHDAEREDRALTRRVAALATAGPGDFVPDADAPDRSAAATSPEAPLSPSDFL